MSMVGYQCPGKALRLCIDQNAPEALQKVDTVPFVAEYLPALYASDDDMVEGPRGVYPCFSRHGPPLLGCLPKVKHKIMNVPFLSFHNASELARFAEEGAPALSPSPEV
jgi:hypothetical protein